MANRDIIISGAHLKVNRPEILVVLYQYNITATILVFVAGEICHCQRDITYSKQSLQLI